MKMIEKKIGYVALLACAVLLCGSCSKLDSEQESSEADTPILFGIEEIALTKVSYSYDDSYPDTDDENGGIYATFETGDEIGLYAFFNNFFYYYTDYQSYAESVIFTNQGLTIDANGDPTYSPLKSWTFSTLYGTAPHTLDVVAYYPFKEGYNPTYANLVHDDNGATLEYYYYYKDPDTDDETYNVVDFMTATTRYDYYKDSDTRSSDFREYMLGLGSIPLEFTRRLASMNFQVTKPDGYSSVIIVTGLTVHFNAPTKFTQTVDASETITWSGTTTDYSLTATKSGISVTLEENEYDDTPSDGDSIDVDDLLALDNLVYLPPGTEILKIVFNITVDDVAQEYEWHAHVAEIVENTNYTLALELDPDRKN